MPDTPPSDLAGAALSEAERDFVKETVRHFYGADAIVRTYGTDPNRLDLHVESDHAADMCLFDCLGVLMTRIDQVSVETTKRGTRVRGSAKFAYRRGVIL